MTQEEREALRSNAFASLEGKVEDKARLIYAKKRLEELQELSEQQWEDPYEMNQRLRKTFREGRKGREKDAAAAEALQDKMSLGLDLLPEHEDDVRRAQVVDFGEFDHKRMMVKTVSKPLFVGLESTQKAISTTLTVSRKRKAEERIKKRTAVAVEEIKSNTRAAMDPFLTPKAASKPLLAGVKRKRSSIQEDLQVNLSTETSNSTALVDYDSD